MSTTPSSQHLADQLAELRERLALLENRLQQESRGKSDDKAAASVDAITEHLNRLTRGLVFAGLSSVEVSANLARTFVEKLDDRVAPGAPAGTSKTWADASVETSKRLLNAIEAVVGESERAVDQSYAKYKERVAR